MPSIRSAGLSGAGERWVLPGRQRFSSEGQGSCRGSGIRRRKGYHFGSGEHGLGDPVKVGE